MDRREELGSAAFPRGKKERAGLGRRSNRRRHAQGRFRGWSRRERWPESLGYPPAHGHALESTRELLQPPAGGLVVDEPDDLTSRGPKAILKRPDGVGPARGAKRW